MPELTALSDDQRRAVRAPDDWPLLIEAGPGSGKTLTLAHRAAWLVQARGLAPDQLLTIAFTNRAVAEMRDRLTRLLGARGRRMPVTTFHAFGHALIRRCDLASGGLSFEQMLAIPLWAFRHAHPMIDAVRRSIGHVLVDEGQDVTAAQAELVGHLVAGHGRLTVVGDAGQCIYGQTAGALGLDWFAARFPAATTCHLRDNYRSAAGIVALADALLGRTSRPHRPAGPPPTLTIADDEWAEADTIARAVVELYRRGVIRTAAEVAILVRLRAQAPIIVRALARRQVPLDLRVGPVPERPLTAEPGVVVMTIHAAKGSEFPVIFIPGVNDGTLPHDHHPNHAGGWPDERALAALEAQLAEERRLLYVAITRAIDRVALSYPAHRRQGDRRVPTARSRFLDDLPAHLLRHSQQPWED